MKLALLCTNRKGTVTRHLIGDELTTVEAMNRLGVNSDNWTVDLVTYENGRPVTERLRTIEGEFS